MKKICGILVCFSLIITISLPVSAQEGVQKVGEGYTTEGVYYEVFAVDEMESNEITIRSIGKSVTREVIYSGIVIPSKKLSWSEKIDGANYSGTLTLSGYSHTTNNTVATYRGTLYKE
ncbi:MAG: hypothetical protein J6A94_04930 [Lachnospiraceae bacterium]|nr:hypothetical protein [Lachnospiraceae bacterium]